MTAELSIDDFPLLLPPLAEQRRIAGIIGKQLAVVEKAKRAAEEQLTAINAMPAAILRKAFSGEI
jgi:type I restriction enzyme S subunit